MIGRKLPLPILDVLFGRDLQHKKFGSQLTLLDFLRETWDN